ncbi:uncharacterized protein LOC109608792 isoform X2 [Aethina tumida]|uniref:uncharacterized protein LOC109608792 isoform X2 n=1 Tax=Aethina tumida TaxID=116153 RepID=UPI002148DB1A|nr:uncharacterized protein LOC109608792 isoform X2 [Aethina tumida]
MEMDSRFFFLLVVFYTVYTKSVGATCYFSQEFQGEYVTQDSSSPGNGILYSTLSVTDNSIPIWGNCHKRFGNNFIFMDNVSETSCIRCLHLKLRSANILQVFAASQESLSKCFTNEESALANCPSEESILRREAAEILLFKTKNGRTDITNKEYCPIDGKYYVNYEKTNTPMKSECKGFNSTVDSCPSGSTLTFRLKGCTFDSYELIFDCMGHWKGLNGESFLVFTDHRYRDGHNKPKYRCAMYKQDESTGKIHMALSKDSTCNNELQNSTSGFEKFVLTPYKEQWPAEASEICTFPKWMQGNWEHVRVEEDTMIYKDHSSFKTYTIRCVGVQEEENRYLIYSRSQCNEESYNCMRIANRSANILEFQIGTNSSSTYDVYTLCADENFMGEAWITQGKLDVQPQTSPGMCPIEGEYSGQLPDNSMLCGKMWSDCRAPELMYYQVYHCLSNEIYEDREYRCLGHWRESGMLYTYTQRNDVAAGTYECFVGSITMKTEIRIKEAGEHCQRDVDPYKYGMKLVKAETYSCKTRDTTPKPVISQSTTLPTKTTFTTRRRTPTTYFDNSIPKAGDEDTSDGNILRTCMSLYIIVCIFRALL